MEVARERQLDGLGRGADAGSGRVRGAPASRPLTCASRIHGVPGWVAPRRHAPRLRRRRGALGDTRLLGPVRPGGEGVVRPGAAAAGAPRVGLRTSPYGRDLPGRLLRPGGLLEQGKLNSGLEIDTQRSESPMQGEASNGSWAGRRSVGGHAAPDGPRARCEPQWALSARGGGVRRAGGQPEARPAAPVLARERVAVGRPDHEVPGPVRAVRLGASRGEDRHRRPERGRVRVVGNDDWTAWHADEMRAAVERLQRKRGA